MSNGSAAVKRTVLGTSLSIAMALMGTSISALSVSDAIIYVLETNPEIKTAEANKQAIEFELEQARNFFSPKVEFEAFAGISQNNGTTAPDLSAADGSISGYEITGRISQLLFDGFETRSEIERQAYRIDAAALRVLERSEVLSLEAVRLYSDVLRSHALMSLARDNVNYHHETLRKIRSAFENDVVGIGDLQQAEERVALAEDTLLSFQLNLEDAKTFFLATVGVDATGLSSVPDLSRAVPASVDASLSIARQKNPSILFAQSDVGSAEAMVRRANANKYPKLFLEAEGRVGEDMGGYEGEVSDAQLGLVMRYEFQGKIKRAQRQEQVRRASESWARLMTLTRQVELEVRQSWSTLKMAQRRMKTIGAQATLSRKLRLAYETEYEVGTRSLLDVLNTQNALFQSEANLVNAQALEKYAKYRLLASMGILLPTLGIEPPEDTKVYARKAQRAPAIDALENDQRDDARSFLKWRKSLD